MKWLSRLVDNASDYFAHRKGLLPLIGMALIVINFFLPIIFGSNWFTDWDLFLHLGVLVAIFGMMLAWAL
jgi:hypothetical protein